MKWVAMSSAIDNEFRNSPKPIYQSLEEELRRNIENGTWKNGDQLPSEEELTKIYKVSRGTVRKSIGLLVEEGLLEKVQGRGTYVSSSSGSYPFAQELISFAEEMKQTGRDFSTKVISCNVVAPDKEISEKLGADANERILDLKRVRSIEGKPVALIHNWIRLSRCPGLEKLDYSKIGLFDAIENVAGTRIVCGVRNFSAKGLDDDEARLLEMKPKDPILLMRQVTYGQDDPIECSVFLLRSDRYQVTSTLYR